MVDGWLLYKWINFPGSYEGLNGGRTQTFISYYLTLSFPRKINIWFLLTVSAHWQAQVLRIKKVINLEIIGSLSKWRRRRQHWEAIKIFWHNPCVFLGIYLLCLPCLFLFSLNFSCFQRVFLNEKIDVNSWNIDQWSSWHSEDSSICALKKRKGDVGIDTPPPPLFLTCFLTYLGGLQQTKMLIQLQHTSVKLVQKFVP